MKHSYIAEAMVGYWGPQCDDFDPGCECCLAWQEYMDS